MKFSVQWLREWVDIDLPADQLAERLTSAGLEVDSIVPVAAGFEGVVVAEITECGPHPDADKLSLCTVDGGGEPLQIVCGAPNARVGLKAPLARVGGRLGDDLEIRAARLRGVESQGMLCSAKELGLSDDHAGLMELPADAPVGEDLRSWLGLDDHSIDVELTPNRADCLGMRGLARDVAASCAADYRPLTVAPVAPTHEDTVAVRLDAPADCPRYAGRVIRGIDPARPTPLWMVERLRRGGVRSVSAVVDCTNYVMLELGQPMHAFDADRLSGTVHVRRGHEDERLVLLDGSEVGIDDDILAIADDSGAIALGGIMGGQGTMVTDATRNLFLESAFFRPEVILGRARRLGMHTDASHRFERGVDPAGQVEAIERLTALLLDVVGGEPGPVTDVEDVAHLPTRDPVSLRQQRLHRVLGTELKAAEVDAIFDRLGMRHEFADGAWQVTPPSARFDIAIEEDLIEEVARIHGYNALPTRAPSGRLAPRVPSEREVPLVGLRAALVGLGYHEAITWSFVDAGRLDLLGMADGGLPLANPIASDMNVMRTSLLPGLLDALGRNQRRQQERVRLFEIGVTFAQHEELAETRRIAAVASGNAWPEQWGAPGRTLDFHDLKGDIEQLLAVAGHDDARWQVGGPEWLHPGQSATVVLGDETLGYVGALHPALHQPLDLRGPVLVCEFDYERFAKRELPSAKPISRFPSVRRDLAMLVPEKVAWSEVRDAIAEVTDGLLRDLLVFDVFTGQAVESGYKSLAIGLILQDVSSTLTDEAVDHLIKDVIDDLASRLGARLRG